MSRALPEWIGKTDDHMPPPRVRARIFLADGGKCHITGRAIRAGEAWQLDHVVALIAGGENRESNLAPALSEPHKLKTATEVKQKAKEARIRQRHLGIKKPRTMTRWAKFDGTPVHASRER